MIVEIIAVLLCLGLAAFVMVVSTKPGAAEKVAVATQRRARASAAAARGLAQGARERARTVAGSARATRPAAASGVGGRGGPPRPVRPRKHTPDPRA